MLYYGKIHHSHESMAESIGAEMIQVPGGNPLERIWAAFRTNLGDRPVICEGGIPLFQAAWMKKIGHCGPVIHLAADEALMNLMGGVDHYTVTDYLGHRGAHEYVDAVLGVSPRLVSEARSFGTDVVKLIHPFPDEWKWQELGDVEPQYDSTDVIAVGSNRPKNNFEMLQEVADEMSTDVTFQVMGPETDELVDSSSVKYRGFVSKEEFLDRYRQASAFALPAISQPFPVSTLEALRAGVPPFVSTETGTAAYIQKIHPKLVSGISPSQFAESLDWYFDLSIQKKEDLSANVRRMGDRFNPEQGQQTFQESYNQAMDEVVQ